MKTEAAKCAAEIRKYLKAKGVKATVKSKNFSMGDSVKVKIQEIIDPKVMKQIKLEVSKYQYGNFDGMQDLYEYTNVNPNIPQTKYLFVEYDYSVADGFTEALKVVLKEKINWIGANPDYEYGQMARGILSGTNDCMAWEEAVSSLVAYLAKAEAA